MVARSVLAAGALCAWVGAASSTVRAEPPVLPVVQQRVGAGFDSNPGLSPPPGGLRMADELGGRALLASESNLGLYLGDELWGGLALDVDGRWYLPGGADHEGRIDSVLSTKGGLEGRLLAGSLALEGGRYAATFGAEDAWSGRSVVRGVWKPLGYWQVGLQLAGGLRAYDLGGQLDRDLALAADLAYRAPGGYVLAGFELDRRDSDEPSALRTELAPQVAAGLVAGAFTLDVQYLLLRRLFDTPDADGVEHLVGLGACFWLLPWMGVFARGELGVARGQANALAYDRFALLAGLAFRNPPPPSAREGRRRALANQGPASVTRGRVRFRFRLPKARAAAVIGTFNAWNEHAGELHAVGDGWFERTSSIPPGRYRYRLVVDGRVVRPAGASAYAPDDFGSEDAVLVVPSSDEE